LPFALLGCWHAANGNEHPTPITTIDIPLLPDGVTSYFHVFRGDSTIELVDGEDGYLAAQVLVTPAEATDALPEPGATISRDQDSIQFSIRYAFQSDSCDDLLQRLTEREQNLRQGIALPWIQLESEGFSVNMLVMDFPLEPRIDMALLGLTKRKTPFFGLSR